MSYTIVLFIALAILGGLIAYLGDLLGAWLGKRRSTIFNLRPRQSARVIAAFVGAMLPLAGLLVATVGSRYARAAVFELNELLQQRQELTGKISELEERVSRYETIAEKAESDAAEARKRASELQQIAADQRSQIVDLTARRDELAGRVDELQSRRSELEDRLATARTELEQARGALAAAREDLATTGEQLAELRDEVAARERRVTTLGLELERTTKQLEPMQKRLSDLQMELDWRLEDLEVAQQNLELVQTQLEDVLQQQELMAEQQALYEPGEELIRVVLPGTGTRDQIESELYEILHLASALAESQGVPEGENGRAVIAVAPVPPWAVASAVPEGMIVRYVAEELREGGAEQYVVMVRAFRRWFPGDDQQLAVQFRAAPNRLLFRKGEQLDELLISSDVSELQAFETLWARITGDESPVRQRAISKGMLPHPETGNYGSVDLAELFQAAEAIRQGAGMMRVRLIAAEDAYTRGPLELNITVTPAEEDA